MSYFKNIIVSDNGAKNLVKLKDMSLASTMFNDVQLARNCSEVSSFIASKRKRYFDIIVTSFRFDQVKLATLINELKNNKRMFNGALLMVLPSSIKLNDVSDHFFSGVDGFLLEPFGVRDLEDMMVIAQNVKLFGENQRAEALELILGQTLARIDDMALKQLQAEQTPEERDEVVDSIRHASLKLGAENIEKYKEVAVEKLIAQAQPAQLIGGDKEKLAGFDERSQEIANAENDFSKENDPVVEAYVAKLKLPEEEVRLVREGIYRLKRMMSDQGFDIAIEEVVEAVKDQGSKINEDEVMERLRKKMEAMGAKL